MAIGLPPNNFSDVLELASSASSVLAIVELHEFVGTVNDGIELAMQGNAQSIGQCAEAELQTELCMIFGAKINLLIIYNIEIKITMI
jgi:hypothetical protein